MEKDHEFPWIEFDLQKREMICTRCNVKATTDYWLAFLVTHSKCVDKSEKKENDK
jgi:hypothetical protein